jgi:citrate lyase subunit beta / citryl-CoA lyase
VSGRADLPPIRSALFVPGSDEKRVAAAAATGADAVVLDLEEPETPFPEPARERARGIVGSFLATAPGGRGAPRWFARVQPPWSGRMLADLRAVLHPSLTGILVPKSQGPDAIVAADALLTNAEPEAGLPRGAVRLWPILETAQAIRLAYEIAMASPRVAVMGGAISRFGDIHQALGFRWTAEGRETLYLRSKVLVDCRAAGIRYPVSGMWGGDVSDLAGLRRFARELRELGYYGMMLGAPEHVAAVNEIFTPTAEEVAYWRELVRLADAAERRGAGPVLYGDPDRGEGHVVHLAHVASARQNLEWAEALGVSGGAGR